MIRSIGLIIISIVFISSNRKSHKHPSLYFVVADSINISVSEIYDSLDLLESYTARIATLVCEVDKCYAIEIDFYWDLIGRFHHYDTLLGQELTKLDHEPFTKSDYDKLNNILIDPNSILASYAEKDLVKDSRKSEIDGFTGATIMEIKEAVIEGAVYSCYSLWNIAHGPVVDSIQKNTLKLLNRDIVRQLVNKNDQELNYFLINNFSEKDHRLYLPEVLQTISQGKGYYAKNAIEKIPEDVIADSLSQQFFAANFSDLDYFTQVSLLKKLNAKLISEELMITLEQNVSNRNSYKNELIKDLLTINKKIQGE